MEHGGDFDLTEIAHFNGGLFDGRRAIRLDDGDIGLLIATASLDWSLIDPTIFGTLFERFLDPDKRAQIGAHYTDPDKIMMIVEPVILRPLRAEWEVAKAETEKLVEAAHLKKGRAFDNAMAKAEEPRARFLERLRKVSILDPACGSGNFLYLALQGVKDIELKANLECEAMGLAPRIPVIGPEIVHGIEINPLAAELARTTIWIGDIQWRIRNGIYANPQPILRKLDTIECRDALVTKKLDGSFAEAGWPAAEFIIGNPPFLGVKKMIAGLGDIYAETIREVYRGRVDDFSDLVCWWFEKARSQLAAGRARRAGLVATNSIRGGKNRVVLDKIARDLRIFEAWGDEAWVVDGASVRVSIVCFSASNEDPQLILDGQPVQQINPDLSLSKTNVVEARKLRENLSVGFIGVQKTGPFDLGSPQAREWLLEPQNTNGRYNADVLRPYLNGSDITRRSRDVWIIDFGASLSEKQAAAFQSPFQYAKSVVKPIREKNKEQSAREFWWRHWRPRPELTSAATKLRRIIVTPRVSKHRLFVWVHPRVLPDSATVAVVRDDETTFGILHSVFHEWWTLRLCTWLGVGNDPRYTPTTTFETFPFPAGLTPNIPAKDYEADPRAQAISKASNRFNELRNAWLNPPDLVKIEPEVVSGFPDRILPKDAQAAVMLKTRTLTNLYNQRPQWLADAHRDLDAAVAAAYGWPADISEEDALANLLKLNLARAGIAQEPELIDELDVED
jgi:type II restriction/modification system DNA methylase subunit YeeA